MAINLSRNTRVWFTTNVNTTTGFIVDAATGFTAANTYELQVLDGYSFSQSTANTAITLSEAGNTPVRGQRSFNTALNPVDVSFSTYIRPRFSTNVTCIERVLWNALTGAAEIDQTGTGTSLTISRASALVPTITIISTAAMTGFAAGDSISISGATTNLDWNAPAVVNSVNANNLTIVATYAKAPAVGTAPAGGTLKVHKGQWVETPGSAYTSFVGSNKNQLQKFAMIFQVDNVYYAINNCVLNQAVIDFGLDAIATIAWTGFGSSVVRLSTITSASLSSATAFSTTAKYITNKLSSTILQANIGGGQSGKNYTVPITGGSITINNNITFITPSNLGTVNIPENYFTGTRSITGTLNAYLKTGDTGDTGDLFADIISTSNTSTETKFRLEIDIGGINSLVRVELEMPGASLTVPTIDIADVVSTTINFTAQGSNALLSANNYDVGATNDLTVRYFSS